jgi:hypothetical protein
MDKFLFDYYNKGIEHYRRTNIPKAYDPSKWIGNKDTIKKDFAGYIEYLLNEVDSNVLTYNDIYEFTHEFYYQCISKHILIKEIKKLDPAFNTLFVDCLYEIDDIEKEYSNTSREIIDLTINLILRPESVAEVFERLSFCSWDHFCVTNFIKHESISNYLLRCLDYPNNEKYIENIIDGLGYQENLNLFSRIEKFLFPAFTVPENYSKINSDIQNSAIEYLKNFELENSIDKLNSLKISETLYEENRACLDVALCKLEKGEAGLIELFYQTNDWEVQYEIVECYKFYQSKRYASFLLHCLNDNTRLENGFYPIRNNAQIQLMGEEYIKLIGWFGYNVIENIDNVVLED